MSSQEGQKLGRYQLVRKLATGGMAEVFLAKAVGPAGFEKSLVIKRILPSLGEDERFVEMFLHEARVAAQLNHPNLVQIFDFGEVDGTYFIAMEFVDGPNLRNVLHKAPGRRIDVNVGARLVAVACEGLAYAHEFKDPRTGSALGLIHRDVSSDNLLLGRNGSVKVVDFGIAKVAGQASTTQVGTVKGKLAYMSPEQLNGAADLRSDVYALGVILYELAAGSRPWEQAPQLEMVTNILTKEPPPLRGWRPEVPAGFDEVVRRAMAKDARDRYQSCRELQSALEDYLDTTGERVGAVQLAQLAATVGTAVARIELVRGTATAVPRPATDQNTRAAPAPKPPSPAWPAQASVPLSGPEGETSWEFSVEESLPDAPARDEGEASRGSAPDAEQLVGDGRLDALLADAEQLRGYNPGAPLLPPPELEQLCAQLERGETVSLLVRFASQGARLFGAHPEAPAVLAERLQGVVTGLLLAEQYGLLASLFERLEAAAAFADKAARWVWESAYGALNQAGQVRRLLERLREAAPADAGGLVRCLRFISDDSVPLLLQAVEQLEPVASREVLMEGLAVRAGGNPAPFLALLGAEQPRRLAIICYLLEKGRAPERRRAFHAVLARRGSPHRNEVLAGIARAGTEDGFNLLAQSLGDRSEAARLMAIELLGTHFPGRVLGLIGHQLAPAALEAKSPGERMALWRAVGASGQPEALTRLVEVLKLKPSLLNRGKVVTQKLEALEGVAAMKGPEGGELLKAVVGDIAQPDPVRDAAGRLLAAAAAAGESAEAAAVVAARAGRWDRIATTPQAVMQDLAMLVQVAGVLDPACPELAQAFVRLRARLSVLLRKERRFRLVVEGGQLQVNGVAVVDEPSEHGLEALAAALATRNIGGFTLDGSVALESLHELVRWLTEGDAAGAVNAPDLLLIRSGGQQATAPLSASPTAPVQVDGDPTREAMRGYADLVFSLRNFIEEQRRGRGVPPRDAGPTLDALVALFAGRRVQFLGLTPAQLGQDALAYHHANVTLLSVAFGVELGMKAQRLRELAEYAFLHDVGMLELPEETLLRVGELTAEDREAHRRARLRSAWFPFERLGGSRRAVSWSVGVMEYGLDWGAKDGEGVVRPRNEIGAVGGILCLAKSYDALTSRRSHRPALSAEEALKTMTGQSSQRFRPDLLRTFLRLLQGQPVRTLAPLGPGRR